MYPHLSPEPSFGKNGALQYAFSFNLPVDGNQPPEAMKVTGVAADRRGDRCRDPTHLPDPQRGSGDHWLVLERFVHVPESLLLVLDDLSIQLVDQAIDRGVEIGIRAFRKQVLAGYM